MEIVETFPHSKKFSTPKKYRYNRTFFMICTEIYLYTHNCGKLIKSVDNYSLFQQQTKKLAIKRGEIRKQAKTLISSRLWTAGKQVTSE